MYKFHSLWKLDKWIFVKQWSLRDTWKVVWLSTLSSEGTGLSSVHYSQSQIMGVKGGPKGIGSDQVILIIRIIFEIVLL